MRLGLRKVSSRSGCVNGFICDRGVMGLLYAGAGYREKLAVSWASQELGERGICTKKFTSR